MSAKGAKEKSLYEQNIFDTDSILAVVHASWQKKVLKDGGSLYPRIDDDAEHHCNTNGEKCSVDRLRVGIYVFFDEDVLKEADALVESSPELLAEAGGEEGVTALKEEVAKQMIEAMVDDLQEIDTEDGRFWVHFCATAHCSFRHHTFAHANQEHELSDVFICREYQVVHLCDDRCRKPLLSTRTANVCCMSLLPKSRLTVSAFGDGTYSAPSSSSSSSMSFSSPSARPHSVVENNRSRSSVKDGVPGKRPLSELSSGDATKDGENEGRLEEDDEGVADDDDPTAQRKKPRPGVSLHAFLSKHNLQHEYTAATEIIHTVIFSDARKKKDEEKKAKAIESGERCVERTMKKNNKTNRRHNYFDLCEAYAGEFKRTNVQHQTIVSPALVPRFVCYYALLSITLLHMMRKTVGKAPEKISQWVIPSLYYLKSMREFEKVYFCQHDAMLDRLLPPTSDIDQYSTFQKATITKVEHSILHMIKVSIENKKVSPSSLVIHPLSDDQITRDTTPVHDLFLSLNSHAFLSS